MTIKKEAKMFCLLMAILMFMLPIFSSAAQANSNVSNDYDYQTEMNKYQKTSQSELEKMFSSIEDIPDEVLNSGNQEEANMYLSDYIYPKMQAGWWECSLAVSAVVFSTAIPVAKITKIKKYVKALGGVKEAAKLLYGASSKSEKLNQFGQAGVALVGELSGFTQIQKSCF